ncbi:MAG: hypothetical protein AB1540_02520 [Bdellovibrionota bacterium]
MINGTKLTGLWKKKDRSGKEYFVGSLSATARFVVFPNGYKSKDSEPDYYLFVVPAQPKEDPNPVESRQAAQVTPHSNAAKKARVA